MSDSLLLPCPSTRNCYTESRTYDWTPDLLFEAATAAVKSLRSLTIGSATEIERDLAHRTLHAPFRVFIFTDDLELRVEPHEQGAVLHVRSASRVGQGDLGTNRRRVEALFEKLGD